MTTNWKSGKAELEYFFEHNNEGDEKESMRDCGLWH